MRLLASLLLLLSVEATAGPRVVVVQTDDLRPYTEPVPAFLEALGEPAAVVNLDGREAEADALIRRLKSDPPAVVFALGPKAAYAVRHELPNTPLIYASVLAPDRYGIPGRQATGVGMTVTPEIYLSQLTGFFPELKTIGLLRGPAVTDARIAELREAAKAVGVELVIERVSTARRVRPVFNELAPRIDALWLQPDRDFLTRDTFRILVEETRRHRKPLLVDTDNMVRAGGMFAVVPAPAGVGRQAAEMARQILDGAAPAILPPEHPDEFLVALNLRNLRMAEIPLDELLLDFVDIVVE